MYKIQKYYIFDYWVCYAALFITLNLSRRPHLTEAKFAHAQSTWIQTFVHVGEISWHCHSAAVFWYTTHCIFSTPHPFTDLDSPSVIVGIFFSCLSCFSFIQAPSWLSNIINNVWSAASFLAYSPHWLFPLFLPSYSGISFHSDWEGEGGRVALWKFLPSDGLWLLLCQVPLLVLSASRALTL